MTLEHAVTQFLEHQLANGCSPHTIGAHQRDLKLLISHLGGEIQVDRITSNDLDRFLLSDPVILKSDGRRKQPTSIDRTRATIPVR